MAANLLCWVIYNFLLSMTQCQFWESVSAKFSCTKSKKYTYLSKYIVCLKDLQQKYNQKSESTIRVMCRARECVRNLDLRVQVHPGVLWVSKQRVHIVLEASKSAGAKGDVPKHTAGLDTIFVQIYMDAPPGVPGVSKNQIYFFTNKTVEFLR